MAVVLPTLRLLLLLLNLYGTFKAMKPPPQSQRSVRNGQGPSARAMQLRKRELKSRLAVWVVWAMLLTLEGPLDRTVGFVTPFYNEFKCTLFLLLLVSRSHGAEAIFLHIIHPTLRPYVPAVDDILTNLHSVFDLLVLLLSLPWEYAAHQWRQWRSTWSWGWSTHTEPLENEDDEGSDSGTEDRGGQRRLRPRDERGRARLEEANRQARVIFQDIDDAQDRVRTQTRIQGALRGNGRNQPARSIRSADPNAVGLRTRRRVLEYPPALPPEETVRAPGSKSTGVHHVSPSTIVQLPQVPTSQPLPAYPHVPTTQPAPLPSQPLHIPTPPSSGRSHEIWHPPQSFFEGRPRESTSLGNSARKSTSPIYPPLPSAYPFTPRRSNPLPPPPRVVTPPNLVTPTPRRVSAGIMSRGGIDAFEGIDAFPGRSTQAGPSRNARSAEPLLPQQESQEDEPTQAEDFFGRALERSIQPMDIDVDTETLSTRDGSSASENTEGGETGARLGTMDDVIALGRRQERGSSREPDPKSKGKRKATTGPLRRSERKRHDRSSSVETDEFGFTIRLNSSALGSTVDSVSSSSHVTSSSATGPAKKKPLARTKPALKHTQEEEDNATESSDEESVKKRRKLKQDGGARGLLKSAENKRQPEEKARLHGNDNLDRKGKGAVQRGESGQAIMKGRRGGTRPTRTTRASTRQTLSTEQSQP